MFRPTWLIFKLKHCISRPAMYVYRNTEARSRNQCCCGKAISITYLSVCACLRVRACMWVPRRVGACMRISTYSLDNPERNAYAPHYVTLRPLGLHHVFRHYFINGATFGKTLLNIKYMFSFSLQLLSEPFLIIRRILQDMVKNVETSSCKVPVIFVGF
jgi:hypothetical protein